MSGIKTNSDPRPAGALYVKANTTGNIRLPVYHPYIIMCIRRAGRRAVAKKMHCLNDSAFYDSAVFSALIIHPER